MSDVALATDAFDEMTHVYGKLPGFPLAAEWDRPDGRGKRLDLQGSTTLTACP